MPVFLNVNVSTWNDYTEYEDKNMSVFLKVNLSTWNDYTE